MNFEKLLKELEKTLIVIFTNKYKNATEEAKKDIELFIENSKEKIVRWGVLVEEGKLTTDDFTWLMKSQKDLFEFKTLQRAGISKLSLGHLKNTVVKTAVNILKKFLLT